MWMMMRMLGHDDDDEEEDFNCQPPGKYEAGLDFNFSWFAAHHYCCKKPNPRHNQGQMLVSQMMIHNTGSENDIKQADN